jgi:nicotinamide mononucleotide transporter
MGARDSMEITGTDALNALEIMANAIMALSIWLAARNNIHTWTTGIVGCLLFGVVFIRNQLYADATLQLFFVATSLVGCWQWLHPDLPTAAKERVITKAKPSTVIWLAAFALAATLAYGFLLHRFTNAYLPYIDSAILALSVISQCLLMKRKVETWPFWITVNTVSIALFASRGLLLTAALYCAYWINAWYGWWRWREERAQAFPLTS